jgi:hypothetical protein
MEEVLRKRAVAINVQSELTDAAEVKKIDAQLLYLGAQRQALPSVQRWSLEKGTTQTEAGVPSSGWPN